MTGAPAWGFVPTKTVATATLRERLIPKLAAKSMIGENPN